MAGLLHQRGHQLEPTGPVGRVDLDVPDDDHVAVAHGCLPPFFRPDRPRYLIGYCTAAPIGAGGRFGSRLTEYLRVITDLWTNRSTTFHGKHLDFEAAVVGPKPVQRPHPPILIGGTGYRLPGVGIGP
ncbi:MAG TPA: LLM class flavin-dependent oxidoreductase [Acidimicrobiales bacterium]|nr:LLM class flavin-dependent oxidoreductase [Acidimicrobiales bacterium]